MLTKIIEKWKADEAKQRDRSWSDKAPEIVLLLIGSGILVYLGLS